MLDTERRELILVLSFHKDEVEQQLARLLKSLYTASSLALSHGHPPGAAIIRQQHHAFLRDFKACILSFPVS